jgi:hypothetical protein
MIMSKACTYRYAAPFRCASLAVQGATRPLGARHSLWLLHVDVALCVCAQQYSEWLIQLIADRLFGNAAKQTICWRECLRAAGSLTTAQKATPPYSRSFREALGASSAIR